MKLKAKYFIYTILIIAAILIIFLFVKNIGYRDSEIIQNNDVEYILRRNNIFKSYYRVVLCGKGLGYTRANCFLLIKGIGNINQIDYKDNSLIIKLTKKPAINLEVDKTYKLRQKTNDHMIYSNSKDSIVFEY